MRSVGIIGTGLIGTSVALSLAEQGWQTAGWDPNPAVRKELAELGFFDVISDSEAEAAASADLVVLAGPPSSVPTILQRLETDGLVTDLAGVKTGVIDQGHQVPRFVSSHPMAGREVSGPAAASASLFRGAAWVVITDGASSDDLEALEAIIGSVGANPIRMTAAEHDDAVAVISHLPQVLAAALVGEVTDHQAGLSLASGSFRDLTRVAASDPGLWTDLLVGNGEALGQVIESYAARLHRWADAVRKGSTDEVAAALAESQATRKSLVPAIVGVAVALADQPGELARVGRALESSRVDVRDLQLRHAPHGGGGILTLSVRPGEAETLRSALEGEGLLLA